MNDQSKIHHNNRNLQYATSGIAHLELMQSESPQVQQKLLLQQLSQEIVNSHRTRYRDSELHYQTQNGSPSSQSVTDNQQIQNDTLTASASISNAIKTPQNFGKAQIVSRSDSRKNSSTTTLGKAIDDHEETNSRSNKTTFRNCQVCLIRAIREDLMNINKVVQERNEQISKLLDPILSPAR